jgi:hypothetical protein
MTASEIRAKLQTLNSTLTTVQEAIASLCDSQAATLAAETPSPDALPHRRRFLPTDWPRIAGRAPLPSTSALLASEEFQDRYAPGENTREIYCAAATGLGRLATAVNMPLYKVSTTAAGRVPERMKELRRDGYAGGWFCGDKYIFEPDWTDWFPSHMTPYAQPVAGSPVTIGPRVFSVKLPAKMSPQEFDTAFDAEVAKGAIHTWAMTSAGNQHCKFLEVDPSQLIRVTPYPFGSAERVSPATEIACMRVREDAGRLITIAELIVLRFLGLTP